MIESVKKKIASFIIKRNLKDKTNKQISFERFFTSSNHFLLIMPANDGEFHKSLEVLPFFEVNKKQSDLLTDDVHVNVFPIKYKQDIFSHGFDEENKIGLPSKAFKEKLCNLSYDCVIDLNLCENIFASYAANLVKSKIKVGFTKESSDLFYNFQIGNNKDDAGSSYKNLIDSLKMF